MSRAINLLETVVVVVILGLLAALAIPRLSRGASPAPQQALRRDLSVLRSAIELYYQDHGAYPAQTGHHPDGRGAGTEAAFLRQLTGLTDARGCAADRRDGGFRYGPYLRDGVPACPVPPRRGLGGVHVLAGPALPRFSPQATAAGWVYNCQTGDIVANSDRRDARGVRYDAY